MSTLALDFPKPSPVDLPGPQGQALRKRLSQSLQAWWSQESADWDALVEGNSTVAAPTAADSDLWGSMPTVDSKAIARTSAIFEAHLGRPLDIRLIRPGGYNSVDDMVRHLVPAMMDDSQAQDGIRAMK